MEVANYLYSSDGKKYFLVNKIIGTDQVICREVMVEINTGKEIPSNNVISLNQSSLYNVPVETYHQKRKLELEENLEVNRKKYEAEIERFRKLTRTQEEVNKDFIKMRSRLLEFLNIESEPLIQTIDFLSGNFKYVVIGGYYLNFLSKTEFYDYMSKSDGMKSVIPNYASNNPDDRKLNINTYSDGSSYSSTEVKLFKSRKDAIAYFKALIAEKLDNKYNNVDKEIIELAIKYDVEINYEKIQKKINNLNESIESYQKSHKKSIEQFNEELKFFKNI